MTDSSEAFDESWQADWASQRRHKLTAGLSVTPAERLAWLEQAIQFAHAAGALPRSKMQLPVRRDALAQRNKLDMADEAAHYVYESPADRVLFSLQSSEFTRKISLAAAALDTSNDATDLDQKASIYAKPLRIMVR